jgi:threonine aldolase
MTPQERVAALLSKEDALFAPTGSMANALAVVVLVQPGQEVLCEASAHVARAELGAHDALIETGADLSDRSGGSTDRHAPRRQP